MNKKICEQVAVIPTKRLRNKVAGFATVCVCNSTVRPRHEFRYFFNFST